MKWSLDTHKFISEIVRTALQVVVDRNITSQSDEQAVKAAEHELADKGVYRSKEGAEGRIKRALLTYFKAYNLMTSNGELTEVGMAFYSNKLSIKELCLHFLYGYKFYDEQSDESYFPLEIILSFTDYCRKNAPEANYISLEDFDELVKNGSATDETFSNVVNNRSILKTVDARAVGYDVWTYMLLESGLYEKNAEKHLIPRNNAMIEFLLNSYKAGKTDGGQGELSKGFISNFPMPNCNRRNVKNCAIIEAKTISAFLFDNIELETIDKLVCPKGGSVTMMVRNFGLDESSKGAFIDYTGYEHLVSRAWCRASDPLVKALGDLISSMEKGIVEPSLLLDYNTSEEEIDADELSPEWFKAQATSLSTVDKEADELYQEFQANFAPEVLKQINGKDILDRLFYSDHRANPNLCHTLEHDARYQLFGGIKGGSSYKFGLFYSKEYTSWVTGSPKKVCKLSENEAIELGTSIRDELVAGAEVVANYGEPKELNDYADLYAQVFKVMPNLINKMWAMKYLHMIFPNVFPVFYSGEWQNSILNKLNIEPKEESFIRMGQIALFVKKCGISNVAFSKVIYKLKSSPSEIEEETNEQIFSACTFDTTRGGAQNKVIYGTPGCGKSYYVQNRYLNEIGVIEQNRIRTTFYQDYTNTDFVGQILPKVHEDKTVTYEFNPGPFALALKMAIENPDKPVALIIEELNRGNAASIFGDIFQLLDRDKNGRSQYAITNTNLQDYLNSCFEEELMVFNNIRIPANLYIVATMNTSDQNVFTLDTAFKRRWQFEKLRNQFTAEHDYQDFYVPGMQDVTWKQFVNAINNFIVTRSDDLSAEDKQLGVYFVGKEVLCEYKEECGDKVKMKSFAYKVFEYLWDDVAKFAHPDWFGVEIKTLDQLIDAFVEEGKQVLANVINN